MIKSNTPPEAITRSYIATLVRIFVLAAFLVTTMQASAFAQRQLVIINKTGSMVTHLYAVSTSHNGWGNSICSIPNGYSQIVNFPDSCRYVKVRADFSHGKYRYWRSLDLDNTGWIQVDNY